VDIAPVTLGLLLSSRTATDGANSTDPYDFWNRRSYERGAQQNAPGIMPSRMRLGALIDRREGSMSNDVAMLEKAFASVLPPHRILVSDGAWVTLHRPCGEDPMCTTSWPDSDRRNTASGPTNMAIRRCKTQPAAPAPSGAWSAIESPATADYKTSSSTAWDLMVANVG
jgi:hypothetical protein